MVKLIAVKKLLWLKNVSRRTLIAFLPALAKPDDELAKTILSDEEYELYMAMDVRDRDHAGLVSKALLNSYENASPELIRAAFLHDIGKTSSGYNPIERIVVHFLNNRNISMHDDLKGLAALIQRKMYHAEYGAKMIANERVAQIVQRHHQPDGDKDAEILKSIEEVY